MPATPTASTSTSTTWQATVAKATTFRLLADPIRLAILGVLADQPTNVGDLCAALSAFRPDSEPITQPAVSHHLALLRVGRLVEPTRSGKCNFYSLTEQGAQLVAAAVAAA